MQKFFIFFKHKFIAVLRKQKNWDQVVSSIIISIFFYFFYYLAL